MRKKPVRTRHLQILLSEEEQAKVDELRRYGANISQLLRIAIVRAAEEAKQ